MHIPLRPLLLRDAFGAGFDDETKQIESTLRSVMGDIISSFGNKGGVNHPKSHDMSIAKADNFFKNPDTSAFPR